MKSNPPCTEAKSKKELVHATSDDAGSQLLPDGNVIEGSENIAKLFTDRELMKDSIFTRCRVNPTASFISWKSISAEGENQSKYQPKPPKQVRSIFLNVDDIYREWFKNQGHWRDIDPDVKDPNIKCIEDRAKLRKLINDFTTECRERLQSIDYDEVKTSRILKNEGTENKTVEYQWTYLIAGEIQVTLTIETGSAFPPHNNPDFKPPTPIGYTIFKQGDQREGVVYFPPENHMHMLIVPSTDQTRFYPDEFFRVGDYELRKIGKNGMVRKPRTPHELKVSKVRSKAGRTPKISDRMTRKAISDHLTTAISNGQKPTTAAKATKRWAKERFNVDIGWKTALNYMKRSKGNGK